MVKLARKKDPQLVLAGPLQALPLPDGLVSSILTVGGVPQGRYKIEVSEDREASGRYGMRFGREVLSIYDASQLHDAGVIGELEAFGFKEVGGEIMERRKRAQQERLEALLGPSAQGCGPVRLEGPAKDKDLAQRVLEKHHVPGYKGSAALVTRDTGYPGLVDARTVIELYPSRGDEVAAAEKTLRRLGFYEPSPARSHP